MATESSKETRQDQVGSSIDDLIRDNAALIETAIALRAASRTSLFERLLLAEAFASALAEAVAPALAEVLAPRVMKVLEQSATGESASKGSAPAASSSDPGQKSETKASRQRSAEGP
jgi:hypothetical protein